MLRSKNTQLGALRIISCLVQFLHNAEAQTSPAASDAKVNKAKNTFVKIKDLAVNLAAIFTKCSSVNPDNNTLSAETVSIMNDCLDILNFMAREDCSSVGSVLSDNQSLSSILSSLTITDVRDKASEFIELVTGKMATLVKLSKEMSAASTLSKTLAAQVSK